MVTIKDIAKAASVSPGTVSFVLNGTHEKRRISAATVSKVQAIAREMGYMPNIAARNLRAGGSASRPIVLAIITSAESPLALVGHLLDALKQETQRNASLDFQINIAMFTPGKIESLPGLLDGSRFNAAFITNTSKVDDAFLAGVRLSYPVVVVGREIEGYPCFVPSRNAGRVAFKALFEAGSRHPVVLHPSQLTQATENRVQLFSKMAESELGVSPQRIVSSDPSKAAAVRAVSNYLKKGGAMDGLFAVHDSLAVGAYRALRQLNLKIPGDVRIVGIGDSEWAPFLDPPLSCAGAEDKKVYEQAVSMMLEDLRAEEPKPRVVSTNARFVRGESA